MKHTITFSVILSALILIAACGKSTQPEIDTKLTDCPANSDCTFSFQDKADLVAPNKVINGNSTVFYYSSINTRLCSATTQLYFKANTDGGTFKVSGSEIAGNSAVYNFICPCCDYIGVKPIGGEIKGKRINGSKWLVNAVVILGNEQAKFTDTLKINQYYNLQKLIM
ncbi:hypothetical protein [Mucilaginibacter dorajii]|uniref:Lipoprotein n=1 Tax=Mucilaginibacter dorajii TaxID=692994 RepID=A0ABP7PHX9_9SPHI|nr:hypothetical protein [Mucilaginibacter dorajii]MCS3733397.1 hypothetical protein [Mucilaginibacter dorajii]